MPHRLALILALSLAVGRTASATGIVDDFESYGLGTFPSPPWLDAGGFMPLPPASTLPSASVVSTLDALGNPTNALAVRDEVALLSGIYFPVPVSNTYSLAADIRVDRFNDLTTSPAVDFAMQLTFAQLSDNLYIAPQVGIYASSFTESWRLFLIPGGGGVTGADIDLGLAVGLGLWYRLQLDFDATAGTWHAQIADASNGSILVNQMGAFADWQPSFGPFDSVAFIEGEGGLGITTANLALVDNINVTSSPVPEPATTSLVGGVLALLALARRHQLRGHPS